MTESVAMRGHSLRSHSFLRVSVLMLLLTVGYRGAARGTPIWMNGDEITYGEGDWSNSGIAYPLLVADYGSVYAASSGVLTVVLPSPAGFHMIFSSPIPVGVYLPAVGTPAPLDQNLVNPLGATSSGAFGGDVLALQLDVDFSDAGFLLGASGIPFGNLVLENFGPLSLLNGRTVRQILGAANTDLGGGTSIFSIADLDTLASELTLAFEDGTPDTFAQQHLVAPTVAPATVPEPASLVL